MKIRSAREGDTQGLVRLGRMMHAESPTYRGVAFDPDELFHALCDSMDAGGLFVVEDERLLVAVAAGVLTRYYFSREHFGAELAIYVAPSHRQLGLASQLVTVLEGWAFQKGARRMVLAVSAGIESEAVERLYLRLGYKRFSQSFEKALA